jgi:hypothetical protein
MKISLYIEGLSLHTSQIYTGLSILEASGLVELKFYKGRYYRPIRGVICADLHGKKVVYEMGDNPEQVMHEYYETADIYFKRMATQQLINQFPKIAPLGFNYAVYHRGDHFFKRSLVARDKISMFKAIVNKNKALAALAGIKTHAAGSSLHQQEALPNPLLPPMIIFSARLWNSKTGDAVKDAERNNINRQRIDIVRKLRQKFGDQFIGGIEDSLLARQECPELILPKKLFTQKINYVKHLRQCTIGIATPGLEGSVGFKLAEYIAFSKAIISTNINALVPGNFAVGKNYLNYTTADDCITMAEKLMADKVATHEMMEHNFQYYQQYLRPDKLVWNSILKVCE